MPTREALVLVMALTIPPAFAGPGLGQPVDAATLAGIDLDVESDGRNLPPGRGTAIDGVDLYMDRCAACHGRRGQGQGGGPALVGGIGSLASRTPVRTVGSYWPRATTLFDYIRRAMPYDRPLTLTNGETYALTAFVLWLNGIVGRDEEIDAASLPRVKMPNRDGFVDAWATREHDGR